MSGVAGYLIAGYGYLPSHKQYYQRDTETRPELIPSTEGPASGFRNAVWSNRPLTPSAAPASRAVIA